MKGTIWCLHGAVGSAADWDGWSVDGWAIRRLDLWRFLSCCPMNLPALGHALNREAEAIGGTQVLLGYSMGGRLALHALTAHGPWSAAIMVSSHPGLENPGDRARRRASDAEWAALALKGDWNSFITKWNAQPILQPPPASPHQSVLPQADRTALKTRRQEIARSFIDWSLGAQEPLWNQLESIAPPVLWVAGERDDKFRLLAERAAEQSGTALAAIAPHASHRVPWENPDWLASRVEKFLSRHQSRSQ